LRDATPFAGGGFRPLTLQPPAPHGTSVPRPRAVLEPQGLTLAPPGAIAKLTNLTLMPGMPVETFIQPDARSPMAYPGKPFTDYFARTFHES